MKRRNNAYRVKVKMCEAQYNEAFALMLKLRTDPVQNLSYSPEAPPNITCTGCRVAHRIGPVKANLNPSKTHPGQWYTILLKNRF